LKCVGNLLELQTGNLSIHLLLLALRQSVRQEHHILNLILASILKSTLLTKSPSTLQNQSIAHYLISAAKMEEIREET
jgi:hypothetical protein